jgi:hypothetical protein
MKQRPTEYTDCRPRIHVWPRKVGCDWSVGPVGTRFPARCTGQAVEEALDRIGAVPAVIIIEPTS